MIGAVLGAAFKAFGPRLIREGVEEGVKSQLSRQGSAFLARRITKYTATESGQRLVARGVGNRFATRLAEHEGTQKLTRYAIKKDVNQRIQGEGQYGPAAQAKTVNINAGQSTVPRTVSDPSTMNVSNAYDPGVGTAKENERIARQQGGGRVRRGSSTSGWAGTGRGWWEQNEQLTQRAAFDPGSVTTLGKFDAARGPSNWSHALGQGFGRRNAARAVGFVEGYRAVKPEQSEQSFDPVNTAGVPSRNAELTEPSSHTSVLYQQPTAGQSTPAPTVSAPEQAVPTLGRQESFSTGTGESTTPKKPRKAAQYRLPGVDWKSTLNP